MQLGESITSRIALVTGASSGLGRAIAIRLAEAGAIVHALGRSQEGLDETAAAIAKAGGTCHTMAADIGAAGTMTKAVDTVLQTSGALHILVNNAGVIHAEPVATMPLEKADEIMRVNFMAPLEGLQAAIATMRAAGTPGHIVNVTSLASRLPGGGIYGASKVALERIAESLRTELENDPIRIVTIVPGGFSTNLGRTLSEAQRSAMFSALKPEGLQPDADGRTGYFGLPDDIARAVVYAVSQPNLLNVYEMVVRPARNIDPRRISD